MRFKQLIVLFILIILVGSFSACAKQGEEPALIKKLKVITTLFPLYDMAKNIGADKADVSLLLPPGVEAHSFEPKPGDIVKINEADVFVYTGKFMEPWAHDIIKSADKKVKVIDASVGIELMKEEEGHKHEHEEANHHESEEEHHYHGGVDPHIWLDFANAKIMAGNIAKAFSEIDPQNTEYYRKNLESYQSKLTELDNAYKNTLSACKSKTIIYGGHYAFGYLAKRYNLEYSAAQGFSPDAEPTANDLINLVKQIKKDKIKYIFYEELTSPKIAETIANETGSKMLLLNAAHNLSRDQIDQGISFFDILHKDLDNLRVGLECK